MNKWYITLGFVLVAIILVYSLGQSSIDNLETNSEIGVGTNISISANIPHKLADFNLVGITTGVAAIDNISRLHGTDIDIIDGFVAEYATTNGESFVLWVSESRDEQEAKLLFDIMDEMMPKSPMFKGHTELDIDEQTVIYVTGAGMENYYWVNGVLNYWVGVHAGNDLEIVELVIDVF